MKCREKLLVADVSLVSGAPDADGVPIVADDPVTVVAAFAIHLLFRYSCRRLRPCSFWCPCCCFCVYVLLLATAVTRSSILLLETLWWLESVVAAYPSAVDVPSSTGVSDISGSLLLLMALLLRSSLLLYRLSAVVGVPAVSSGY